MAEKKDTKKQSSKVTELVEEVSKLSVLELSELVNALQEKLGVTSVAPVPATPQAAPATGEQPAEGAQAGGGTGAALQTVIMTNAGANKIAVIKALREINPNLGLKEAKDMTEATPVEILKDAKGEDAKSAADKIKAAGAMVESK